ncbi:hypothetical protein Trydic_g1560 [Trypoxylus dichotomus]
MYKTVLRPIVTYASAVWATTATTHMHKLRTFQNRILQMALRNTAIHEDDGVTHGLHPRYRQPILGSISIPLKPPRIGVSGLRPQDPLEVSATTATSSWSTLTNRLIQRTVKHPVKVHL